jgi:D-lactate dehydrogenase
MIKKEKCMRILFYDAISYDEESFNKVLPDFPEVEIVYHEVDLSIKTVELAKGFDGVCAFVNSDVSSEVVKALSDIGVKLILLRCAGFNNVDIKTANECGVTVLRVPGYSPEAVAELAMTLAMSVNRHIHKAYIRRNNYILYFCICRHFWSIMLIQSRLRCDDKIAE